MIITEINIDGFGKLENMKIMPQSGLNAVFGQNESGKTTLMFFIRAMLYGVGSKKDLREKYRPLSGAKMGGSMCLTHNGEQYRIEREFKATAATDITAVWNITSGEKLSPNAKIAPGELILGVNAETFENTLFIRQSCCGLNGKTGDIITRLNNIVSSGDENSSYTEACERLTKAKNKLTMQRAKNGIIDILSSKLEKQKQEKAVAEQNIKIYERLYNQSRSDCENIKIIEYSEQKRETEEKISRISQQFGQIKAFKESNICLEHLKTQLNYNGGVLISNQLEEQKNNSSECLLLKKQCEDAERELGEKESKLKTLQQQAKEYDKISTRENDVKCAEDAGTQIKRLSLFTYIICIAFVLIAAIAVKGMNIGVKIAVLLLCVAAAALYIGFKYNQNKKHNKKVYALLNILNSCGCKSVGEFYAKCEKANNIQIQAEQCEREVENLKDDIKNMCDEITDYKSSVSGFLRGFSLCSGLKPNEAFDALENAIQEYTKQNVKNGLLYEQTKNLPDERELDLLLQSQKARLEDLKKTPYDEMRALQLAERKEDIAESAALLKNNAFKLEQARLDCGKIDEDIKQTEAELGARMAQYNAIMLAGECLENAYNEMQKNFSPLVNNRAGEILCVLTGGKYKTVTISKELAPTVLAERENTVRDADYFSAGTTDQIYFALRMAISELVFNGGSLPLFLDDSFNKYDDLRMKQAVEFTAGCGRQSFLFTCLNAEKDACEAQGANIITM